MKVIYQSGLEALAHSLHTMGFEMHAMQEQVAADAVLFAQDLQGAAKTRVRKHGAMLLNVRGLSAAQTAEALRRRCNGPLF
ncbi:MAG: hypothetical protein RR482_01665 [Clostridia bacterium]